MRWLLVLVAVGCLGGAWWASSAAGFVLMLAVGVIASLAAALAFAKVRIEGTSQPEVLSDPEIEALRSAARRKASGDAASGSATNDFSVHDSSGRRTQNDA